MRQSPLAVWLKIMCAILANAASVYLEGSHGKPRNDVRPNIRLSLTPRFFSDSNAVSLIGEFGSRITRLNGTYSCYLNSCNRLKIGAEYLNEKLTYQFIPGNSQRWIDQYAVGGVYQRLIQSWGVYSFDIAGQYSHAQSKHLSNVTTPENAAKLQPKKIYHRRIAGSNAWDALIGFTLVPWNNGSLKLSATYDHVKYNKKYTLHNTIDSGTGAVVSFNQYLTPNFELGAKAEFKCPYTYIQAQLNWYSCLENWGGTTVGVYAGHTRGRNRLPDSTEAGIQLGINFGVNELSARVLEQPALNCAGEGYRGMAEKEYLSWLNEPAVYLPQVLAKSDIEIQEPCSSPTSSAIPNFTSNSFLPLLTFSTQLAKYFNSHGNALTFSTSIIQKGTVTNPSVSIDPISGVLFVAGSSSGTITIEATAKNVCGSTSQTFNVTLQTSG